MKKYLIYSILLLLGVISGAFLFNNSPEPTSSHENHQHTSDSESVWSCAMHPQIRKSESGKCPICGMDLSILESTNNSDSLIFKMSKEAIKISNIQTSVVQFTSSDSTSIKLSGKIKVDETHTTSIVSQYTGRIEKLYLSYSGEKVSIGQRVASIYSPQLIAAQEELIQASKLKSTHPQLYQSILHKLKLWKITDAQIELLLSSNEVIENFTIYSDVSGFILNKKITVGDYFKEGQILFDVQNLDQVWAVFDVYENDLKHLQLGQKLNFKSFANPNQEFSSSIHFISPSINPSTRTTDIRLSISNTNGLLKPEMFIEGSLYYPSTSSQLKVPKSAVLWTGERSVVYVKVPSISIPSFEYREVLLGNATGNDYLILDGLKTGEEVVTNGAFVIDASAQLNNQSSMMNKNLFVN